MGVQDYNSNPASNTTINGINIAEGCAPSGINNAIRQLMADVFLDRVPVGVVLPYGGATAPSGWALCYGQAVSRTTYATLFSALGTRYGNGNGSTTFNLPDMRGRAVFGKDDMGGTAAGRVTEDGSGIDGETLGATGGSEFMQEHDHTISPNPHSHAQGDAQTKDRDNDQDPGGTGWAGAATTTGSTSLTIGNTGDGDSENMPPAIILNWIIKLQ